MARNSYKCRYTLIDGSVVDAEGPVVFLQALNPQMDFEKAAALMRQGAEVRRVSNYPKQKRNDECGITCGGEHSRLPVSHKYWFNTGDGYQPYTVTEGDRLATDWVLTVPPEPMCYSTIHNIVACEILPPSPDDLPDIYAEMEEANPALYEVIPF